MKSNSWKFKKPVEIINLPLKLLKTAQKMIFLCFYVQFRILGIH